MRQFLTLIVTFAVALARPATAQTPLVEPLGPLTAWTPPLPCEDLFTDVPCGSQFDTFIEQFYRDGITLGCDVGMYCPNDPVTRRQMAVFVERAMRGGTRWPPNTVLVFPIKDTDGMPNFAASGAELLARVASVPTTGDDVPTDFNPWTVLVAPGYYSLGSATLEVPANVTLRGSGRSATRIGSSTGGTTAAPAVKLTSASVADLSIMASGSGSQSSVVGLAAIGYARVIDVDISSSNGTASNVGVVADGGATLTLTRVNVNVFGDTPDGIRLTGGRIALIEGGSVTLEATQNSVGHGLDLDDATAIVNGLTVAAESQVGSRTTGLYLANASTCEVTSSTFEAETDSTGTGIGCGASIADGSTLAARASRLIAVTGGGSTANSYGIYVTDSSVTVDGGTVSGSDYGMTLTGATAPRTCVVKNASLLGGTRPISNGASYTTTLAYTDLGPTPTSSTGTLRCVAVSDLTTGSFWATTCP